MRRPGLAVFRLDLGEAGAGRRIGDADEMVAGWTLNLPPGELRFALQGLVAVGTIKFEIVCVHKMFVACFYKIMRKPGQKSI
jgi:hypothetical protein